MVTKQFEAKTLCLPADTCDNAVHALRQLMHWVDKAQAIKTPVLRALLAHGQRALINLDAALRMAERVDPGFQPNDAPALHVWLTCEDVLKDRFACEQDGADALPANVRTLYYACEKALWDRLPADFRALNLAETIHFARHVIQQTLQEWTAPARYSAPPQQETDPHAAAQAAGDAMADALEAAARFDRAVAGA